MEKKYDAMQAKGWIEWKKATDLFSFSALPAGRRLDGSFYNIGSDAGFWSSSFRSDLSYVYIWGLTRNDAGIYLDGSYKDNGWSVRCIKDEE